jgi:glycosyltransferase involved in cell wall biosynthesis
LEVICRDMLKRTKIVHIITGLSTGGAETMLYKLVSRMDKERFANTVVSLTDKGALADKIEASGVAVEAMGMRRGVPDPRGIWKLRQVIRRHKPDIIQTWMYHADLMGGVAARMAGRIPVVWNIRHSNLDPRENKRTTLWTAKACALLSGKIPRRIVCCSESSRKVHAKLGYDPTKMLVIPNGFDLKAFRPRCGNAGMLECWNVGRQAVAVNRGKDCSTVNRSTCLIGMVARFDPQKDHQNLVQAAKILKDQNVDAAFVLCGRDVAWENDLLASWIRQAGLEDRFFLLGPRDDIPMITAGLDIAVLSSAHGEGFPNVLGEAMASEVPCVATDVGDSADIVGDTGLVVPPRDSEALAWAIRELVEMDPEKRSDLGKKARRQIKERFALESVVNKYEDLYSIMTIR